MLTHETSSSAKETLSIHHLRININKPQLQRLIRRCDKAMFLNLVWASLQRKRSFYCVLISSEKVHG